MRCLPETSNSPVPDRDPSWPLLPLCDSCPDPQTIAAQARSTRVARRDQERAHRVFDCRSRQVEDYQWGGTIVMRGRLDHRRVWEDVQFAWIAVGHSARPVFAESQIVPVKSCWPV